jgi:hypothetical protein
MYVERHVLPITVDASGDAIAYTPVITGEIRQIIYTKNNYADTVDFAVTVEDTGENIWTQANVTASAVVAPRIATHTVAGVAALYAGGGSAVLDKIAVAKSRIKVVVDEGGVSTSGTITIVVA